MSSSTSPAAKRKRPEKVTLGLTALLVDPGNNLPPLHVQFDRPPLPFVAGGKPEAEMRLSAPAPMLGGRYDDRVKVINEDDDSHDDSHDDSSSSSSSHCSNLLIQPFLLPLCDLITPTLATRSLPMCPTPIAECPPTGASPPKPAAITAAANLLPLLAHSVPLPPHLTSPLSSLPLPTLQLLLPPSSLVPHLKLGEELDCLRRLCEGVGGRPMGEHVWRNVLPTVSGGGGSADSPADESNVEQRFFTRETRGSKTPTQTGSNEQEQGQEQLLGREQHKHKPEIKTK